MQKALGTQNQFTFIFPFKMCIILMASFQVLGFFLTQAFRYACNSALIFERFLINNWFWERSIVKQTLTNRNKCKYSHNPLIKHDHQIKTSEGRKKFSTPLFSRFISSDGLMGKLRRKMCAHELLPSKIFPTIKMLDIRYLKTPGGEIFMLYVDAISV